MARSGSRVTSPFTAAVSAAVGERPCVVALGGGADSALLLDATVEARGTSNVRAVFIFHGLESSGMLQESAANIASYVGVELIVLQGIIEGAAGIEERARRARYELVESVLTVTEVALTGHTMTDQAETVLMRLTRGSGAAGLSGIPTERGPWRRPFLVFERDDINAEAANRGLPFVEDPANTDDRYFRSFVRAHIIPPLESSHAPGLVHNIARSASLLRQDEMLIASLAAEIPVRRTGDRVTIAVAPLVTAARPVATRAVRSALRLVGDQYPGSANDVDRVLDVAITGTSGFVSGHVEVRVEAPFVVLQRPVDSQPDHVVSIETPGTFTWNGDRYSVSTSVFPTAVRTAGRFSVMKLDVCREPFEARGVRDGDTLDIGMGSAHVGELLREHGVPARQRSRSLLVTCGGKIAAIHGVRAASWAQPTIGEPVMIIEREVHS